MHRECGMLLVMPPSRRPLRVLHTADVHLESDGYGDTSQQAAHRERERRTFRHIVDRALSDQVDLLLIAGDLFDHNRASDEAVEFVRRELARLRQPVVILPGNHDVLRSNAIYDRHDFTAGASHVHLIRQLNGETIDLPALDTVVWGRAPDRLLGRRRDPRGAPTARLKEETHTMAVEVAKVELKSVQDGSGLEERILAGQFTADQVVAVVGKTEGNGGVNDFTRLLADHAFRRVLIKHGKRS